jgi:hypothetical protein
MRRKEVILWDGLEVIKKKVGLVVVVIINVVLSVAITGQRKRVVMMKKVNIAKVVMDHAVIGHQIRINILIYDMIKNKSKILGGVNNEKNNKFSSISMFYNDNVIRCICAYGNI